MVISVDITRKIGEASSLKLVKGVRRTYYWGYSCKNCSSATTWNLTRRISAWSSYQVSDLQRKEVKVLLLLWLSLFWRVNLILFMRGVFIFLYCVGVFCCSNFFFMTSGEAWGTIKSCISTSSWITRSRTSSLIFFSHQMISRDGVPS